MLLEINQDVTIQTMTGETITARVLDIAPTMNGNPANTVYFLRDVNTTTWYTLPQYNYSEGRAPLCGTVSYDYVRGCR